MAEDHGEYDFDLELYCIVCDRQIDPTSAPLAPDSTRSTRPNSHAAPSPPTNFESSVNTSPAPPHPTPASNPPIVAPKRTGSGHSAASHGHKSNTAGGGGGGLKRNKSSGKVHHAAGGAHRKNHSHANLRSLAPMTDSGKKVTVTAVGPAAEREKGKDREREREKEREKEKEKEKEKDEAALRQLHAASTLYCSEECRRVDETRNQLTLAHLGSSESPVPLPFPLPSPSSDDLEPEGSYASMVRRRSSGVSSSGSTSYAFSSAGERGLSPIMSAAPTSNPGPYLDSSGFPFPSVSSASSSSTFARPSPQNAMVSHPSNSSLNSLPSQQSYQGPPPLLNFSSRRQSRGAHSSGAYSYRPSLMERVHSTDSVESGTSDKALSRTARSLSIGGGGISAGLFNRVRSMDGLAMMGRSDSESSDREGRQSQPHRPPSALSSLRSMTPISNGHPTTSSARSRPPLSGSRHSEPVSSSHGTSEERPSTSRVASDSLASSASRSRSRSRKSPHSSRARSRPPPTTSPLFAGSDPPDPIVGSLPAGFGSRGPSLGSPTSTTSLLRPVPMAPDSLLAPRRTSSSASLALLGSSVSRSYDHRSGPLASWTGLKRTDSTAGLSGLVAVGEISAPSASAASPPPSSSSTASTFIPAPSTYQPRHPVPARQPERPRRPSSSHSHPHSSPSSATSSFGPSHSSIRTSSSSRRSTAASSDHWQGVMSSSLGSNAGGKTSNAMSRTRSGSSSRPDRPASGLGSNAPGGGSTSNRVKQGGLTMTPSSTNLTSIAPPSPTPRTHSTLAPAITSTAPTNSGLAAVTGGGGGAGGTTGTASRTWSWTNLHVPTYQALDVSEYRAQKERSEKAETSTNGAANGGSSSEALQKKERKRLFYFSDHGD